MSTLRRFLRHDKMEFDPRTTSALVLSTLSFFPFPHLHSLSSLSPRVHLQTTLHYTRSTMLLFPLLATLGLLALPTPANAIPTSPLARRSLSKRNDNPTPEPPKLQYLFTANLKVVPNAPLLLPGPKGIRLNIPIIGGTFEGLENNVNGSLLSSLLLVCCILIERFASRNRFDSWRYCRLGNYRSFDWNRKCRCEVDRLSPSYKLDSRLGFSHLRQDFGTELGSQLVEQGSLEIDPRNWSEFAQRAFRPERNAYFWPIHRFLNTTISTISSLSELSRS